MDVVKAAENFRQDFQKLHDEISKVIVGGESGHGARPMHPAWVRDIRDQCEAHAVAFFFKQWGAWAPVADDAALMVGINGEIHDDARVWPPDGTPDSAGASCRRSAH